MMGSLTPPWADELLSRNTKIARKMMSSMSTESYLLEHSTSSPSPSPPQRPNRFLSVPVANPSDPISPLPSSASPSVPITNGTTSTSSKLIPSSPKNDGQSANKQQVVDPSASSRKASSQSPISTSSLSTSPPTCSSSRSIPPSSSSSSSRQQKQQQKLTRNTEKLSPIRNERDSMFVDDEESIKKSFGMTNGMGGGGEDLSIIEYGPGIVKKLRSRYQSLALRQFTARPSLRRSASLENCLDAVSAEELAATLESKISNGGSNHDFHDNEINGYSGRQTRQRNRFMPQNSEDSRTSSPASEHALSQENNKTESQQQQNGKSSGGPRGRTSGHDASARRDRMRRARSVDALHRTKREEEILEKFKHVVLPKEEIVIIEVSKPQQGSGMENGTSIISGGATTNGEKRFPTRLLFTANNLRNSNGGLDQQTANRVRNLMISPEHELPPHDIVRETARIFERNQENLNRRIGQALRLSKSASASGLGSGVMGSSPLASPESPTPTATSQLQPQQKTVTAQSTTSSSPSSAMQPDKQSFSTKTSSKVEATNSPSMVNGPSHGQKQIGIIKPTLSNSNGTILSGSGNTKIANGGSASVVNGGSSGPVENNRVRSPILSPIGLPSNKPLLLQNSLKPPLSPKPIFTSSPKVSIPVGGNKGKSVATESSPSTSPILIIENKDPRSLSPFKSESPIPRVKSPLVSSPAPSTANRIKAASPTTGNVEERNDAFMRSTSPLNGKTSPIEGDGTAVNKRLGNQNNLVARTKSPIQEEKEVIIKTNNKTVPNSVNNLQNGLQNNNNSANSISSSSSEHHRQQVTKDHPPIPVPPPRSVSPAIVPPPSSETTNTNSGSGPSKPVSQLRVHQKQKSSQSGGNGSMVFNFTSRKEVPNYIEDDGLRRAATGNGSQMGAGDDPLSSLDKDSVDNRIILKFEGANIIINGRSSIQKRPKSQKLSISFNESATTTHEYPSESSFAIEEEPSENENSAPKKPNVISGSSLGSYTPKVGSNTYQLGSYTTFDGSSAGHNVKKSNNAKQTAAEEAENDFIEDYLKPNTESTTWSNEMGSDIMF